MKIVQVDCEVVCENDKPIRGECKLCDTKNVFRCRVGDTNGCIKCLRAAIVELAHEAGCPPTLGSPGRFCLRWLARQIIATVCAKARLTMFSSTASSWGGSFEAVSRISAAGDFGVEARGAAVACGRAGWGRASLDMA